ncbi:peptidylprolyl isomerase [Dyella sp. M7H15-1]|uniref:peptidylprolyl isomerase n=1 Tax=Dyella sp. M7H15-1 TaxID=2501295 RepID=UPI0010051CE4|nr:peptidylprolyl isomerase [Dyella sp. M7H15-1]QAU24082.1 peptidylprolyl isomerase [Dyella sp. M7H15-1]
MKQIFALFLLTIVSAVPSLAQAQLLSPQDTGTGLQPIDRIVAVVEDNVILQSELNDAVATIQQQYASQPGQLPPIDVLRRQVLDRLILMKLQLQRADDQGVRVSDSEVDQAVQNVAAQNKMTPDQLHAAVEQNGLSYAAFRQQLHDQLVVQKLHQNVVHDSVSVTNSEIDNLLNSPSYKSGEVHLAHIQISIPSGATAADIQAAQNKAEQALAAVKGGMNFKAAAIRFSDAQDALDGGDLGWRRLDEVPAAFVDTVDSLKNGEVSGILHGPTGFHILQLIGTRAPSKQMVTEYHARQILIRPSELLSPTQAQQKAEDLYNRIVNKHEDFAKLAKDNSNDDTTANAGGDMNWFQQGDWGTLIGQKLDELKDGEVSQPFQSEAGWHIVQRLGARSTDMTKEVARDQARQAIGNRKADQAYDDFLRQLRSDAYVKILAPELQEPSDANNGPVNKASP